MPWKSQAQAAWGHSPAGKKALGGSAAVAEWDSATKGKSLPKRVSPESEADEVISRHKRRKLAKALTKAMD